MKKARIEFSLNVFTELAEFSDKKYDVFKRLFKPLALKTRMLPQHQQDKGGREDI